MATAGQSGTTVPTTGSGPRPARDVPAAGATGAEGSSGPVIVNPVSGERIRILDRAGGPGGDALVWELVLAPGGHVPSRHRHPHQCEHFQVLDGVMDFGLGRRRARVEAGSSLTVPPGQAHHFANRGPAPVRVRVETTPALDMEALLYTAAALAADQHRRGAHLPHLADLVLFMGEFGAEVASPWAPAIVGRAARHLARLLRCLGREKPYRRLRSPAAAPGPGAGRGA
jgi:quercetin dioxygenase-like cupin family protein